MLSQEDKPSKLDYNDAVYGSYMNFKPRHHVFEGFKDSEEFNQYLSTLMEWKEETTDGLKELGVERSQSVEELEVMMGELV